MAQDRQRRECCMTRRKWLHAGLGAVAASRAVAVGGAQTAPKQAVTEDPPFKTPTEPPNRPIGEGKGIHPGRVTWAHEPKVATWDESTGNWWDDGNTNPDLVREMLSGSLRALTGERTERAAWKSLFQFFDESRKLGRGGYRPGDKIAVKLNCNQDRPGAWRRGAGMPTPQVVYAVVEQLISSAGVRGEDIVCYDASRYIGDPIFDRIRANPNPNFQAVQFVVSERMAGNGRIAAVPDKSSPIRFSRQGVPTAYPPQCVTQAKYVINLSLARAHDLMGVTETAKNQYGSVYFEGAGFTPAPLHSYSSRDLPMGSYNSLVDLIGYQHLGGKTLLYVIDFLYVAVSQNNRVVKYESFGDHWCSSLFLSQDPVAIDSVVLDFIRNEPRALQCRGYPENYLHEAALAAAPPSKTLYDPNGAGKPLPSLGVHEHWNNPSDKQYSRNLGKREGIELVRWRASGGKQS